MSDQTFDFVVTGVSSGTKIHIVSQQLAKALKQDPQYLELRLSELTMGSGADFPLIRQASRANVDKLQAFLNKHGIQGEARQTLAIEEMIERVQYTCPACGYQQDEDGTDICQKCGVVGSRYDSFKRKKDIYDAEKRYMQADVRLQREQSAKSREKAEEDALREDARRQLGLKSKKQNSTAALLSFLLFVSLSAGGYWFWQQQVEHTDQMVLDGEVPGTESGLSQASIAIQPQGGNLTLTMPASVMEGSTSNNASVPANPYSAVLGGNMDDGRSVQLVTEQTMPSMQDEDIQHLALSMYQQAGDVKPEEAKTKASIMAMAIDDPAQQKTVLQLTGHQQWQPESLNNRQHGLSSLAGDYTQDPLIKGLEEQIEQKRLSPSELDNLLSQLPQSDIKARLILRAMDVEWKASQNKRLLEPYIEKIVRLAWHESNAEKQVLIQGTLSQAYQGLGNKKLANVNLVMAIQSLGFVNSEAREVDLLCELASYQRQVDAFDVARELYQLAEQKASRLPVNDKAPYYAKLSEGYAAIADFNKAVELFEWIDQPELLQASMLVVENMQQ